jgi:DNA-binding NarL/FixJ family response regulator
MKTSHTPEAPVPQRYLIALVEDQPEVCKHWKELLDSFDDFNCVRTCASGEEALKVLPAVRPDLVLMDIFLPRMSGIECTVRLKELLPQTLVLMLTASDNEDLVFPAFEAGADGYLAKHIRSAELRTALLNVLHGGAPMSSGIARRVVAYFRERAKKRDQTAALTARETEVLLLLSKGYSNKEIADKLALSVDTVQCYLKHVYRKLHVRSRTEALLKYLRSEHPQP